MANLIRMNLYRMLHTGSTWILMVVICGFAVFSSYMTKVDQEMIKKEIQTEVIEETDNTEEIHYNFGIQVQTPIHADGTEPVFFEYFCSDLKGGILLIFVAIFAVTFISGEEKSGFVKNIAGQVHCKYTLYLSKIVAIMTFVFMAMVCYGITEYISVVILHRGVSFGMDILGQSLLYILIQWALLSAFASGMAFITTLIKSTAVSITIGILDACGFGMVLIGFIYKIFRNLDIVLEKYLLVTNANSILYNSSSEVLRRAAVVAAVFFVGYNVLGSIWVQKRDIG